MKRRKDSGFTLIELMIVIAVIGILAIVLVPRVGVVKNTAKEAGLDTNVRLVQGYVESKISKWVANDIDQANVVDEIVNGFTFSDATKQLVNPITNNSTNAKEDAVASIAGQNSVIVCTEPGAAPATTIAGAEGSVVVVVNATATNAPITDVEIFAYGVDGKLLSDKTVTITP